ncbi:MAG: hypothetical protein O3C17_26340 [Planctomycetota bacterium]|nr:hypothetical protein [Planctomycetota bacterium]
MFPNGADGSLPSGNRGTVNIGGNSNSTAVLIDQIYNGVDCNDLDYHGGSLDFSEGPVTLSGNPGISNGMKTAVTAVIGQPRVIFLFTAVTGNGANTEYTVVRVVGARIMAVTMTGPMSNRAVIIQPASLQHPSLIPGSAPISTYGTLLASPRLVK